MTREEKVKRKRIEREFEEHYFELTGSRIKVKVTDVNGDEYKFRITKGVSNERQYS